MTRRLRAAAVLLLAGVLAALPGTGTAAAAGYRYWSFWEGGAGTWTYATQGPAQLRPADGDTVGFRFAVSEDSAKAAQPRAAADFAKICAAVPERADHKRIALVVDFGTAADAPSGETPPQPAPRTACATVDESATAADALAAVAKPLRYDSAALLCAISGYPRQGCAEQVSDRPAATASPKQSDGGPSLTLPVGLAALAALAAAAVWQSRRRRSR
ncbi:hypothetical protein LG634_30490 [Streptomyces bambusae]|uniref:SCO2322 family protein n=1 Tax=Streptomyces bambusae TaxID=1550616 RepID=UPI001CFF647B|nr:SCO2322 family protein [Streptomyces bambusae]MCB5169124.1 hypothetical protein [Streptomyces bambusae]